MNIAEAVNIVKNCVPTSDFIPILKNIYIGDRRMLAFNGMQGISVNIDSADDIKCVVNGEALVKMINSIPPSKLKVFMEKKKLLITAESVRKGKKLKPKTNASLVSVERNLFKAHLFDKSLDEPTYTFKMTADVIKGIASCVQSVKDSASNIALSGLMLEIGKSKLSLYGTDAFRMSRYICNHSEMNIKKVNGNNGDLRVLLPKQLCGLITSLSEHITDQTAYVTASSMYIRTNQLVVYSKLPQSVEFPDYESVIQRFDPKETECTVPSRLQEAINRCTIILSKNENNIDISFSNSNMKVYASSPIGEVNESIGLKVHFNINPIRFDADRLKQAVSLSDSMSFVLSDETKSVALVGKKDDKFTHVLAATAPNQRSNSEDEEENTSNDEE